MLVPVRHKKFRKEYSLMEKRRKDMAKLDAIMWQIISEQPLPPHYEDHLLVGNWKGCRECLRFFKALEPNWLLIYRIDPQAKKVVFERTGSHADLFD